MGRSMSKLNKTLLSGLKEFSPTDQRTILQG